MAKRGGSKGHKCGICGRDFKSLAGLRGHGSTHDKKPRPELARKPEVEPIQAQESELVQALNVPEAAQEPKAEAPEPVPEAGYEDLDNREPMPEELAKVEKRAGAKLDGKEVTVEVLGPEPEGGESSLNKYIPLIAIVVGSIVICAGVYFYVQSKKKSQPARAPARQFQPSAQPYGSLEAGEWGASE